MRKVGFLTVTLVMASLMVVSIISLPETDAAAADRMWTSQIADDDYYASDLVMAVDAQGFTHMLYCDCVNGDLYYTHQTAGGWETVYLCYNGLYDPSFIADTNAIAVDSSNRVHLVFSIDSGELFHISDASVPSTLASLGEYGIAPSLAAGADGSLHLSFVNLYGFLCYRSYNGAWSPTVIVDESLATVSTTSTSIAVGPSGDIHIAYADGITGELRYAFKQGGAWASYSVGTGAVGVEQVDLALDSMGDPHIAYRASVSNDLWYCHYDGGWLFTAVDTASNVEGSVSIAIDDGDVAHIAYGHFDYQNSRVKYATIESGIWTTSIIDDSTVAVGGAYVAVLPDGSVSVCTLNDAYSVIYYRGTAVNTAPSITTSPSTSGRESLAYSYAPSADKAVNWSVRTNAPFLAWNGAAVTGTPGLDAAGTYWVNITATASGSGQYDHQNYTLVIGDSWSPSPENEPGNGQETVGYSFEPRYNETVTVTAHSTNAPFLVWDGSAFTGTPGTSDAGIYWINLTATSVSGLLSSYHNMTFAIGESWAPTFTNEPEDGRETVGYTFAPSLNETAQIVAHSTNAPFLTWDGSKFVGTPGLDDAGTYWINITAVSVDGLLSQYQNVTVSIADTWQPQFTNSPPDGQETVPHWYMPAFNESVTITAHDTNAPFLIWDGSKFTGTPGTDHAGSYWVNITAVSVNGLLSTTQNMTFVIGESWSPTFTNAPEGGQETAPYVYGPQFNEEVIITDHRTNAPFLSWNGDAFAGTPTVAHAGTYWINITAMSFNGLLSSYQNATLVIGEAWMPEFTNPPADGQETVDYAFEPSYNETVSIMALSTSAPFLGWNGNAFVGTPGISDAGTYWVNISVQSVNGLLTDYRNWTFVIGESWAPLMESDAADQGRETVAYSYAPQANETVEWSCDTNAPFLAWTGTTLVGTPGVEDAGEYYVRLSAVSVDGKLTAYQNFTLSILDTWAPQFVSAPADGQETVAYEYEPTFNETVTIAGHQTNAPFLTWNGEAFVGTPGTTAAGSYWINVTALSVNGLLSQYQNATFVIGESWAPTFLSAPPEDGLFATLDYEYDVQVNETAVLGLETDASFLTLEDGVISGTLAAGTYYVNVTATSIAGHLVSWQNYTLVVVEDGDVPTVEITSPADGALLNSTEVTVSWTATDDGSGTAGMWYRVDGGDWTELVSADLVLDLAEGDHIIEIRVEDRIGNEAVGSLAIHIDTTVPTVVSAAPQGDSVSLEEALTVAFSEAMNQTSVVVTVNGQPVALTWSGNNATLAGDWDYNTSYAVIVTGSDLSGNALAPYAWSFRTEIQMVTVEGVVLDADGQPVVGATISVGGLIVAVTDANGAYSFTLPLGSYNATVCGDGFLDKEIDLQVVGATIALNVEMDKAHLANPYLWIWPIFIVVVVCVIAYAAYRDRKN